MKMSRWGLAWLALVLLLGAGGLVYVFQARQAADEAEEPALQTAVARQGDLVVSASGSGVLSVAEEIELGFEGGGLVTGVFVQPGDWVEAGALLAQLDSQDAQRDYEQARRNYEALTSPAAIAAAQEQVAQSQTDLDSAWYDLEYLISPQVVYWERQVEDARQARKQAKAVFEANPSSQEAGEALEKARAYLDFAEDELAEAWELYYEEYIPETFRIVKEVGEKDIYDAPTDLHILLARAAIEEAQNQLAESKSLYDVLTGGSIPEGADSDAILQLQQAERELEDAQAALEGAQIFAPISGTILSVDVSTGNTVGGGNAADTEAGAGGDEEAEDETESTMETAIVMADLSNLALEVYLDEADWALVSVGSRAEVSFDALPEQVFTGAVIQLDEELYQSGNASVIRGTVQLDSGMEELGLPIGASATVDVIHAQAQDAVLVPVEALHEASPGQYAVFVVEGEKLRLRVIEVGLQGQLYAEVKSGLQAGEVVSTGLAATN
ncbi:MAG: efflux RND transporter periplasmic adaptor subunit [Chloroflexota bacterium]